jgi:uncharacterized membrane protein YfcA
VHLTVLDYVAAGGAAAAAGAVNAVAGGGTLISFPTLVALGVPAVNANVTNTVSLVPGYIGGSYAQREDLRPQLVAAKAVVVSAAIGGLAGSVLLVNIPGHAFRIAVPYLILLSCALLLFQDRLRSVVVRDGAKTDRDLPRLASVFVAGVYGGFFGGALGIVLLAILGLFSTDSLVRVNALKQGLSFVVNFVAAVFFAFSHHVVWQLVSVMAVASVGGGLVGGRLVSRIDPVWLRRLVVIAGFGVAIALIVT